MRLCILQNKPYTWEKICHFLMHLRQGVSWGYVYIYIYIPSRFFENQPNEIGSHLNEKGSKDTFLKPKKFQNHSNEAKGKEEKKERGEGKEEKKKKQWLHS